MGNLLTLRVNSRKTFVIMEKPIDNWRADSLRTWRTHRWWFMLLALFPCRLCAHADESLFRRLDSLISCQPVFVMAKEQRVGRIRERLSVPHMSPRQEYDINESLYQEYMAFRCDSAYHYATRNMAIAKANGWDREFYLSTLRQAHILSVMALFDVAEQGLRSIRKEALATAKDSLDYYMCYSDLHLFRAEFTVGTPFYAPSLNAAQEWRRRALRVATEGTTAGVTCIANYHFNNNQRAKAIRLLERYLRGGGGKIGTRDYSVVTSDLAFFHGMSGDKARQKHYLLLSAISDAQGVIMENNSLRELASMLMDEGEYDRAYRYINVAVGDARFYGTRLRNMQAGNIVPKIIEAYHCTQARSRRVLVGVTVIISVVTMLLFVALFLLLRYLRRYRSTTRMVEEVNDKLNDTVTQLRDTNLLLQEGTRIKEQYLGRFMELASTLIQHHEERWKQANRYSREHKMENLFALLKSNSGTMEDTKLFYANFDEAFLDIYPDFPDAVNTLMLPECRFVVKGKMLNTELRILALLRLDITDNRRISAILRSSITTIYTYRSKMKARSIVKDDFEARVAKI